MSFSQKKEKTVSIGIVGLVQMFKMIQEYTEKKSWVEGEIQLPLRYWRFKSGLFLDCDCSKLLKKSWKISWN